MDIVHIGFLDFILVKLSMIPSYSNNDVQSLSIVNIAKELSFFSNIVDFNTKNERYSCLIDSWCRNKYSIGNFNICVYIFHITFMNYLQ